MTHIWQGLRSGQWLTAARVRGYSLILLGPIHDSSCWDRGTLKRLTLHRKKLGGMRRNFRER